MTMATAAIPAPFGAITIYRLVVAFENVVNTLASWHEARQTRAALAKLSEHQLADIGLTPGYRF